MSKRLNLVIDFDTILYRQIIGLQSNYIEVEYKNNSRKKKFKNLTEFKGRFKTKIGGWLGKLNKERKSNGLAPFLYKDFEITNKSKVIASDNKAKEALIKRINEIKNYDWVNSLKLIVAGDNNFRYDIYKDYKANRPGKPIRFKEIKDWFVEEFKDDIIIAEGCESDDILNILSWEAWDKEDKYFCAGYIDKDCDQSPGRKWNYDKDKFYELTEFEAHFNLCIQCLVGDKSTDNIPGIPSVNSCMQENIPIGLGGFGPVKAKRVLENCKTINELYKEVEFIYECYYNEDYKWYLNLTYKLVKLLSKPGHIQDFPFTK